MSTRRRMFVAFTNHALTGALVGLLPFVATLHR
jgi:hypothetical protein